MCCRRSLAVSAVSSCDRSLEKRTYSAVLPGPPNLCAQQCPREQTARCFPLHAAVDKTHNGVGRSEGSEWSSFMTMLCVSDPPDTVTVASPEAKAVTKPFEDTIDVQSLGHRHIFRVEAPNSTLWIGAVADLDIAAAKARVVSLMQADPCEYLIFSQKTGHRWRSLEVSMPYASGETPGVGDYIKNQWERLGTVTRVHFAQHEEDLICIRWHDEGLKPLFSPAAEYMLVFRKAA